MAPPDEGRAAKRVQNRHLGIAEDFSFDVRNSDSIFGMKRLKGYVSHTSEHDM